MDTIFALASARGRAGVAVIRISGPGAPGAVRDLAGPVPVPRQAVLRILRDGAVILDQALVVVFGRGASFTGEEVAELHLHGSVATVAAVLACLGRQPGLRLAEPGEFTRRALENGCLDLAQVEGLSDLIDAETEGQRVQALRVLSGAIGRRAEHWRSGLIRAASLLEATIDFADEDVPVDVRPEVLRLIGGLLGDLRAEAAASHTAERIRDGFEVAIVGLPNSGKSTLLNALAGREAAITSEHAGTTRDVIEVRMDLAGLPVTLLDTAGLRQTDDVVESIGVARAIARAAQADLRVFLTADGALPDGLAPRGGDLVVGGKADLAGAGAARATGHGASGLSVSGLTGQGIAQLIAAVTQELSARAAGAGIMVRARHRNAILRAAGSLESAQVEVEADAERAELAAEHLRAALRALDSLVGRVDVEDLLGEIFASFCIGK